jgi:phage head morphogenesis protein, SPP1 gp7 family
MPNSSYWQDRFTQIEAVAHNKGIKAYSEIENIYQKAQRELESKINTWYQRFAINNDVSMAEARKMLNAKELKELKWTVEDYIKYGKENALNKQWIKELENASARFHISRLESLKLQTQQSLEVLYGNQLDVVDKTMRNIYSESLYRTAFEVQKGFGVGFAFDKLDENRLSKVIGKPWAMDGVNFSNRIWKNKEKLINELHSTLVRNIISGADPAKAIKEIENKMNVSRSAAGRLIMTESAYFSSVAQKDMFNDLDVEKYQIVATLDNRTSEICSELDGNVFDMKDYEAGVTAPPFHPNCRTTTIPYFDDWEELGVDPERIAKDEEGNNYYVPADMTYEEWKKQFVEIQGTNADFMGHPKIFKGEKFSIKAYEVKELAGVFTQTNSSEAQKTMEFIKDMKSKGVLHDLDGIVIAKNLPGIAAYDHENNLVFINEKVCESSYIDRYLKDDYFIAENAEDILKHEMFHKKHWDFVMTKGDNHAIIKNKLEADLHKYVAEQQMYNPSYITRVVCDNAYNSYRKKDNLNELIAEVLLQEEKGIVKDRKLLQLVRGCVE